MTDSDATVGSQEVLDGCRDETAFRWTCVAEIRRAGIAAEVARRYGWGAQGVADLTTSLDTLLLDRIVGVDRPPSLDLVKLADGKSLHGWARQFAKGAALKLASNARRTNARRTFLGDDAWESVPARPDAPVDDPVLDGIARDFADQARNRRHAGLVHLQARTACAAWGLPQPPRLIDLPTRQSLLDTLSGAFANREAARQAADLVGAMWSPADQAKLDDLHPIVATALATAALTPTPPPQAKAAALFVAEVKQAVGEKERKRALALARAWIASATELNLSEYSPLGTPQVKSAAVRRSEAANFAREARNLVRSGVTIFGATPDAVSAHLAATMVKAEVALAAS